MVGFPAPSGPPLAGRRVPIFSHCRRRRAEPCLLGLYSVVALLYWLLPSAEQEKGVVEWAGKATVTFSDAITAVRRGLWTRWVFPQAGHADTFAKLPEAFQQLLLYGLAPSA